MLHPLASTSHDSARYALEPANYASVRTVSLLYSLSPEGQQGCTRSPISTRFVITRQFRQPPRGGCTRSPTPPPDRAPAHGMEATPPKEERHGDVVAWLSHCTTAPTWCCARARCSRVSSKTRTGRAKQEMKRAQRACASSLSRDKEHMM